MEGGNRKKEKKNRLSDGDCAFVIGKVAVRCPPSAPAGRIASSQRITVFGNSNEATSAATSRLS